MLDPPQSANFQRLCGIAFVIIGLACITRDLLLLCASGFKGKIAA